MKTQLGWVIAIAGFGCTSGTAPDPSGERSHLRVVHTVPSVAAVDVSVGGETVTTGLGYGQASPFLSVPAGAQPVAIRRAGGPAAAGVVLSLAVGDSITVLTIDSSSVINPWVLTDSGAVVPAGKSKLRVVHFAGAAPPIDIWRTQPDFPSRVTVQFPFHYRAVSPYLQSDPGTWTVEVSAEQRSNGVPVFGGALFATGPIVIPAGESRTVVLMDGTGGGFQTAVITP